MVISRLALGFALLAAGAGATTLIGIGSAGAAQPPTVQNVREQNLDDQGNIKVHEQGTATVSVANSTLPVHEQGTVPAVQSGSWDVASSDVTALAGSFVGAPAGSGAFTEAVDADVSHYRTVRVMTNCFSGGACGNIAVNVYSIVGNRSYLLDTFPMQNFVSATHTYDVPGELIAVQLRNDNASAVSNIGVAVYGRSN